VYLYIGNAAAIGIIGRGAGTMNGFDTYQETAVSTQSRGRLVVMLYEGAIRFLRQAILDIERSDYAAKGKHIGKAQDILYELNAVLDMEQGGQIAQNLRGLYNFMHRHLTEANQRKDPQMIREVIGILDELNQSWRAISS
jgi:flagellar protein FliS